MAGRLSQVRSREARSARSSPESAALAAIRRLGVSDALIFGAAGLLAVGPMIAVALFVRRREGE